MPSQIQKVEFNDLPNLPRLELVQANKQVENENHTSNSKKATFRKFMAENNLHPQVVIEQSLTEQFKAGILQQKVCCKEIDPHTLIHKAILEDSPEVIQFLLNQGVNVDYPDQNGMTPLTIAVLTRCNYAVEVLLSHGANTNPRVKWNNMNLLEIAFHMKDVKSANQLITHGVDVNALDKNGETLLTQAIFLSNNSNDWKKVVVDMINHGANVNSSQGTYPPIFAAVQQAYYDKNHSLLNVFIEKGADLNMVRRHQNGIEISTPLLDAISSGNLSIVKLLVENGANVNKSVNFNGMVIRKPIQFAVENSHAEIVKYLLQNGARA